MIPSGESDQGKQRTVPVSQPLFPTATAPQLQGSEHQSNFNSDILLNLLRQSCAPPHHVSHHVGGLPPGGGSFGGRPPLNTPPQAPPPPGFFHPGIFPQAPPYSPYPSMHTPPPGPPPGHHPFPQMPPHLQSHQVLASTASNASNATQPAPTLPLEQLMSERLRLDDSVQRDQPLLERHQHSTMEHTSERLEQAPGVSNDTPENGTQTSVRRVKDHPGVNQMSQREGRWVDIMERSHDGRAPVCDMNELNRGLEMIATELTPTKDEHAAWIAAFDKVKSILGKEWPNSEVVLFGSAANGLSVRQNNDIDVCIQIDDLIGADAEEVAAVVEKAGDLLIEAGMSDVLALPKARVPVVKFVFPPTKTKVDVTVNNTLACINTKMLRDYCAIDSRLAKLVSIIKHWAKRRVVNDPYNGTLSSYCYVLMCIHHLQTRSPPVLPVLQGLPPTFSMTVGQWKAEFFDDIQALKGFGKENKESLAQLVWEFFEYWAWRHNYNKSVVSIRVGGILTKDEKEWTKRIGSERHLLCVEDPFVLSHDLGRTVDRQTQEVMRKEFWRAATILRDFEHPLPKLFEPYKPRMKRR